MNITKQLTSDSPEVDSPSPLKIHEHARKISDNWSPETREKRKVDIELAALFLLSGCNSNTRAFN